MNENRIHPLFHFTKREKQIIKNLESLSRTNQIMKDVQIMKRVIAVIISICFVMISGCSKANINNVSVYFGKSEIYSQQDMDSAVNVIKKEFLSWKDCELHTISYEGDEISKDNLDYCNELREDAGFDECIVFESSFHSPKNGGGAWNPDEEYTGYRWYLARKGNRAWILLTSGYA